MSFADVTEDPFGPSPVNLPLPGGGNTGTLQEWIAVLDKAAGSVDDQMERVVSKGALNIKNDWRDRWMGIRHAPMLPYTVTYDVERREDLIRAEIGPDKLKEIGGGPIHQPGRLGNVIEFGTVNNAPIPGGMPALDAELPRFERAVADLAEKLLS